MDREIVIREDRLRKVSESFAWIDHRFWREGYLKVMNGDDLRLYIFLLLVGNRNGVSWWRERSICKYLRMNEMELKNARIRLIKLSLIAYASPYYQVLSLPKEEESWRRERGGDPCRIGDIIMSTLRKM